MASTEPDIAAVRGARAATSRDFFAPDKDTKQQVVENADDLQLVSKKMSKNERQNMKNSSWLVLRKVLGTNR